MGKQSQTPAPRPLGSIRADELLPVREACRRLGWERRTLAHAKREGLRTIPFGRFRYVTGAEVLRFFASLAEDNGSEGDTP